MLPVVAPARPELPKDSVCAPLPATTRLLNVATPFTAFNVIVPPSVPVPLAIEAVTAALLFTRLPAASRISITDGIMATPLTAPVGCDVIASCVGEPMTMKLAEVVLRAGVAVVNCSVCWPLPTMARFVNVATPLTALIVTVPPSVPVPLARVAVTARPAPLPVVTTRPALSSIRTTG